MPGELGPNAERGDTALTAAARYGQVEIARMLLDVGAQVDLAKEDGGTATCVAAQNGHEAILSPCRHDFSVGDISTWWTQ